MGASFQSSGMVRFFFLARAMMRFLIAACLSAGALPMSLAAESTSCWVRIGYFRSSGQAKSPSASLSRSSDVRSCAFFSMGRSRGPSLDKCYAGERRGARVILVNLPGSRSGQRVVGQFLRFGQVVRVVQGHRHGAVVAVLLV